MEEQQGAGPFWKGLLAGFGLAAVALALAAGMIVHRGVDVTVQTGEMAGRIEREVEAAVKRELPAALARVKAELPAELAAEAGRRLAETRIDLGGFEVPVPPAAVQQVEKTVGQALRVGLDAAVGRIDVDGLAGRLGDRAGHLAGQRLREVLAAQAIAVEVAPGLKVPVRLNPR